MGKRIILGVVLGLACAGLAPADTHYVDKANLSPDPPYTNGWASAADNIQSALDLTVSGDIVLVTNGIYDVGGRTFSTNIITNRVVLVADVTLMAASTNPADTTIAGAADPVTTNGPAAVRCVASTNSSSRITGFTLSDGHTHNVGGMYDKYRGGIISISGTPVVSNCAILNCSAISHGGGAYKCALYNCVLSSNSTVSGIGGGAYAGAANSCRIVYNFADGYGGGVGFDRYSSPAIAVENCVISDNTSATGGGGANNCALLNCTIVNNSTYADGADAYGGGLYKGSAINCIFQGNTAEYGGAMAGVDERMTAKNCLLAGNVALIGGATYVLTTLLNCTVVSNRATYGGAGDKVGGVKGTYISNSIVYFNYSTSGAGSNYSGGCSFSHSCTWPQPPGGYDAGNNVTNDPRFVGWTADNYRLAKVSPCINAGTNGPWCDPPATDLDGNRRIINGIVDIGAYEFLASGTIFRAY